MATTPGSGPSSTEGGSEVAELSYSEAGAQLDTIIEEFETGVVDVDRLVERLERATDIVDELDRRLRRTRMRVEELVPRLESIGQDEVVPEDELGVEVVLEVEGEPQYGEDVDEPDGPAPGLF